MFKTKKEAELAGYLRINKLLKLGLIPNSRVKGVNVKNSLYFDTNKTRPGISVEQLAHSQYYCNQSAIRNARVIDAVAVLPIEKLELCRSKTEWSKEGRKLKENAVPIRDLTIYSRQLGHITYPIYRYRDTDPKREVHIDPPKEVGVLISLFTINRASKRDRDRAYYHYIDRNFAQASLSSKRKRSYYTLKDAVIEKAVKDAKLSYLYHHADLAVYGGQEEGQFYSFHSHYMPADLDVVEKDANEQFHHTTSNFKKDGEVRLRDGLYTLFKYTEKHSE